MKKIQGPIDLDQAVRVLQYLPEADYLEVFDDVHRQLDRKRINDRHYIVNNCPKNYFPTTLSSLKMDADVLSWGMRRRFKRLLKKIGLKMYRTHNDILDSLKKILRMSDEEDEY